MLLSVILLITIVYALIGSIVYYSGKPFVNKNDYTGLEIFSVFWVICIPMFLVAKFINPIGKYIGNIISNIIIKIQNKHDN